ncbi:MAG: TonB-dependent receptor, partial [Myxococcota bacterium]
MPEPLTTHAKALDLNLDPGRYGSFAEIGAGQEVGRWFFRVGGAAGTIAKTVSAYDKNVSDAIYGTSARYVSSGRLQSMLDHEYDLLVERLDADRGVRSAFFAFADTVTAQNYRGNANCHGWMGIRFQIHARSEPSQIILHARMLDRDTLMQHEALGILGVNLVYGAARLSERPEALLSSLLDNRGARRIEIDMVEFSGAAFRDV